MPIIVNAYLELDRVILKNTIGEDFATSVRVFTEFQQTLMSLPVDTKESTPDEVLQEFHRVCALLEERRKIQQKTKATE